jgi:DNA-binding NarL/FixJ family response regulator
MAPDTVAKAPQGAESGEQVLRVILADDDVLLRSGLASLLQRPGFEVLGQVGDGRQLVDLVRELAPDIVVVDVRMPPTQTVEGLEAAQTIRDQWPDVAIMVLSAHVDVDDFVDSLRRIARGASVIDPALVEELFAVRRRNDPLEALSPREHEVLALMAEGRSNVGIAQALWVTEGTVEKHVRSILTKLGLAEESTDHRRVLAVLTYLRSH